jgi:manganese transport protein
MEQGAQRRRVDDSDGPLDEEQEALTATGQPTSLPHSLEEIHSSVPIPLASWWRRFLAFSGPAFLISVGYMDPGNWGTDLEAGSAYGYRLLWVLWMSNVMAILLQSLATRLGVVTGRDLAQACRESYPRATVAVLWVLCEIAIAACDLAEVVGTVIALKLLFGLPYAWGVLIAALDTFLLLALQRRGVRLLELVTLGLIAVIGFTFVVEIVLARPDWAQVARGLIPGLVPDRLRGSLYISIAMLGATVMPHNLYLHSALVQTRAYPKDDRGKRLACRFNLFDSLLALNGAFFVNAGILVLAAATFTTEVKTLQEAHRLLHVWGPVAAGLFAVALLASGQSSTLTGTLAGQVVMEGFVRLRLQPWVRRLVTRLIAIAPAMAVIALADAGGRAAPTTADGDPADNYLLQLVVLSQAVLSFQLPFAIVPLVQFTSNPRWMGRFASAGWLKAMAWACAAVVIVLNGALIWLQMQEWAESVTPGKEWWVYLSVGPIALALGGFLAWITVYPWVARPEQMPSRREGAPPLPAVGYRRIGVAVELEGADGPVLAQAATLARAHGADLLAIHVVEGLGAIMHRAEADDQESRSDRRRIAELIAHLRSDGLHARGVLGYGRPADELIRIVRQEGVELLVVGSHGHRFIADMALGRTVSPILHGLRIPVFVVPIGSEPAKPEQPAGPDLPGT